MTRSYDPDSLVALPRLNAADTVTLVTALITAAKSVKRLPANILAALAKLTAALKPLQKGLSDRLTQPDVDPTAAKAADHQEDLGWSAFHDWLSGWMRLPGTHQAAATAMYQTLFPDGLKFILILYTQEWAEVEARMAKIVEAGLDKTIADLGGPPFLAFMKAAHAHYGTVLGITDVKQAPDVTSTVGEPLAAVGKVLKKYVVKVSAHADDDVPATEALVEQLLRPLTNWNSPTIATKAGTPPSQPPSPPATPATSALDAEEGQKHPR